MGNYEQLKQSVSDVIKTNGNQEITGSILQNVLLTIISSVGANATFAGIATPTTNPGTPDGSVFYLASESGTYSNFGSIELQDGLSVLMWNGSWSSQQVLSIDDVPTAGSDNLVKSGGVYAKIKAIKDAGYVFAGIATPATNPGTPDGSVFWLASEGGTYTNFNAIELQDGLSVLMWNGSWSSQQIFGVDDVPTVGSYNLVKSGGVQQELALGAAYDVSAKNPTAGTNNDGKFESLSALLEDANIDTLIPVSVRKGGMSIKFVQSSDNKYVKFFCTANEFTTDVTKWQGVDDEPKDNSHNLVESKGVYNAIQNAEYNLGCKNTIYENTIQDSNRWKTIYVNLLTGNTYCVTIANSQPKPTAFRIESSDGQIVGSVFANEDISNGKTFFFTPQSDITILYIKDQTNDGYPWNVLVELYTTTKEGFSAIISNFTDNYILNRYIKELYIVGTTIENLTIEVYATDARQVVLRKNGTVVANKYFSQDADGYGGVLEVPQYNGSGVKAYIIVDWDNISRAYIGNVQNAALKIDSNNFIKEYLAIKSDILITKSLTNHFYGKRLLAIGDSVTAAGEWQKKVGELLNMEIRTHAKGGIGIIEMVDGDGSGNPPADVDPDDYGTTNLYALAAADVADVDAIVIHGFYNAHNLAYLNLGTKTDMYPTNNTFIGQLNYAIKRIFECLSAANNPMCKVYISAPHKFGKYQWNDRSAYDDGDIMLNGVKLCSEYNSVYLIDCMNGAGFNKYNWNVFQNSPTPYNPNYIPSDGVNDGTNKPFASLNDAPAASENKGKIITILGDEGDLGRVTRCYISNGTDWQASTAYSTPWNADQLHPSSLGYEMLGCFIAKQIMQ